MDSSGLIFYFSVGWVLSNVTVRLLNEVEIEAVFTAEFLFKFEIQKRSHQSKRYTRRNLDDFSTRTDATASKYSNHQRSRLITSSSADPAAVPDTM